MLLVQKKHVWPFHPIGAIQCMRCLGLLNISSPTWRPRQARRANYNPPHSNVGWCSNSVVPFLVYGLSGAGRRNCLLVCSHVWGAEGQELKLVKNADVVERNSSTTLRLPSMWRDWWGRDAACLLPWRLNSSLRTNYCFAYLHLEHRDYPSLAGNVTTLHLSMVHFSSMSPSECSLICFVFQVQCRELVMVMLFGCFAEEKGPW